MSTQQYPVNVTLKNDTGKVVGECTLTVSSNQLTDTYSFSGLPAGVYDVEYSPPPGMEMTSTQPSSYTLTGTTNEFAVGVRLVESDFTESYGSQGGSSANAPLSPLAKVLGLTVISLVLFGTSRLLIDFFPKSAPASNPSIQPFRPAPETGRSNPAGQSGDSFGSNTSNINGQPKPLAISTLDSKLKACLVSNLRDLSGIPTLAGLAKKVTLLEVTEEQIRKEVNQLYDRVDRLRSILKGCDPKLARDLLAARTLESGSNQLYAIPTPVSSLASSLPSITISPCNCTFSPANFRSAPTLGEWAILGIVEVGQAIYLTGRTNRGDGVVWHEAIAPNLIAKPGQPIQTNQTGWIAECFVRQ